MVGCCVVDQLTDFEAFLAVNAAIFLFLQVQGLRHWVSTQLKM
jgi:hypothetical protein